MAERKLERKNANKNIPYRPSRDGSDSDPDLAGGEDISEEDLQLYGVGNFQSFQRMCEKIGQLSITPDEWESGRRPGSSPSRSPVPRVHTDSLFGREGSSHGRGSPVGGSPAAPPLHEPVAAKGHRGSSSGTYRLSWGRNSPNVEVPVPSTSYDQTVRPRGQSKSSELNPTWMTEERPETSRRSDFTGFRRTPPREVESPRTPKFKPPWPAEMLPDSRHSLPGSDRGSRISTRGNGPQSTVSGPLQVLTIASPGVRELVVKETVLSPPRDFDYSSHDRARPASLVSSPATQRHNDLLPSSMPPAESSREPQESSVLFDPTRTLSSDASSMPAILDEGGAIPAGSDLSADESTLTEENGGDSLSTDVDDGLRTLQPRAPWRSWKKVEFLGRGSFGTVYEAVSSDGTYFAVKEVPLDMDSSQSITQLEQEIALLSHFRHENIVQYLGTERTDQALYIFLELVTKGSLVSLYKKYKLFVEQIQIYTRQILRGLKYLHDRNIVHRDVKCANILVDTFSNAKLADFGMAKQINHLEQLKSCKGSANWMAPEVVNPTKQYHLPADIWSLGCTVLEMATGAPPFANLEWIRVFWKVGKGESPPIPEDLNEDMQDFIRQCFEVDPSKRPTAAELLQHPFLHSDYSVPPSPSSRVSRSSRESLNAITEDMLAIEPNGEATF